MKPVLLALLAAALPLAAHAGDPLAGKLTFDKLCGGCHQIGPEARPSFGPPLTGVIGRHAGVAPNYDYSDAMKGAGFTWDKTKIAAFVESPSDVVPGTRMRIWWMGSDQKMEDLLSYIEAEH